MKVSILTVFMQNLHAFYFVFSACSVENPVEDGLSTCFLVLNCRIRCSRSSICWESTVFFFFEHQYEAPGCCKRCCWFTLNFISLCPQQTLLTNLCRVKICQVNASQVLPICVSAFIIQTPCLPRQYKNKCNKLLEMNFLNILCFVSWKDEQLFYIHFWLKFIGELWWKNCSDWKRVKEKMDVLKPGLIL